MRALVHDRYGPADVLQLRDVPPPVPGEGEVRVAVRAAAGNRADYHLVTGRPYVMRLAGLYGRGTRGVGADLAGVVDAVGPGVTRFAVGDAVFGGCDGIGAIAELACLPEDHLAPKPAGVSYEDAAAAPMAGLTALQALRDSGGLQAGHSVLINGASGGVGTYAVQIAKALGARVTAVCSTRNVERVRALGADRVVDYTVEDFTEGEARYDVFLDNVGNRPLRACRRLLATGGAYVTNGGPAGRWLGPVARIAPVALLNLFVRDRLEVVVQKTTREDLELLARMLAEGSVRSSISDAFPLEDAREAMRVLFAGRARGKVVVTMESL